MISCKVENDLPLVKSEDQDNELDDSISRKMLEAAQEHCRMKVRLELSLRLKIQTGQLELFCPMKLPRNINQRE